MIVATQAIKDDSSKNYWRSQSITAKSASLLQKLYFIVCCERFVLKNLKQPPEVFHKKSVLENFGKFTERYLWPRLFFRSVTLRKNRLQNKCFPVYFWKFLKNLFYRTPPCNYFWKIHKIPKAKNPRWSSILVKL